MKPDPAPPVVDVLIPTCDRPAALAVTLMGLAAQSFERFRILLADQSSGTPAWERGEVQAVLRYLRQWRNLPRQGMAAQRAFLLERAEAPYCLFLDDDVITEPGLLRRMHAAIVAQGCGFVGSALHGLSFVDDVRPRQQAIAFWEGRVTPERVRPGTPQWERHHLHSAANLLHVQRRLGGGDRLYRVAWVGGCVLFDARKLRAAGGFDFRERLPPEHCGEDVLAQLRVMERFGGCGLFPSGAYHMELPTTLPVRTVDAARALDG